MRTVKALRLVSLAWGMPLRTVVGSVLWTVAMDAAAATPVLRARFYQWLGQIYYNRLSRIEARYCRFSHLGSPHVRDGKACVRCGRLITYTTATSNAYSYRVST